jgi:hypothetical protein
LHFREPCGPPGKRIEKARTLTTWRPRNGDFPLSQYGFQQLAKPIEFFFAASKLHKLFARERLHVSAWNPAGIAPAEYSREFINCESDGEGALDHLQACDRVSWETTIAARGADRSRKKPFSFIEANGRGADAGLTRDFADPKQSHARLLLD